MSTPRMPSDIKARLQGDPVLMHHLAVTSGDVEFFALAVAAVRGGRQTPGNARLAANMAKSIAVWVGSGLRLAAPQDRERRIGICNACPNSKIKVMRGLYRLLTREREDRVCAICGCLVRRKASLQSERCPDKDHGVLGRWA